MTREEAIKILKELPNSILGVILPFDIDFDYTQALDMAIKSLEQKPRWILVSEGLPEEPYGCLVTVEVDDRFGEPQRVIYPEFVGYDGDTWNMSEGIPIPFEVIAWQPLPKPYESEEK